MPRCPGQIHLKVLQSEQLPPSYSRLLFKHRAEYVSLLLTHLGGWFVCLKAVRQRDDRDNL